MENNEKEQLSEMELRGQTRLSNAEANHLTRECLQQALLILLEKKQLSDITVTELAKKAGVSCMAFYRNYKSKLDIVREIRDIISDDLNRIYHESQHVTDVRGWLIDLFKWAREKQDVLRMLVAAKLTPEFNLQSLLKPLLPQTHGKPFYAQLAVEGAFTWFLTGWLERGMQEAPEEMADIFLSFWNAQAPGD